MALMRWRPKSEISPFRDLLGIQEEINRLFDVMTRRPFEGMGLFEGEWAPVVDVAENANSVVVKAELPGMTDKDIEVLISGDSLTIKGEKKEEKEDKKENYHRMERRYGSFRRVLQLPSEVKADNAQATFKNGVLQITIPKSEKAEKEKKKVEIKT